MKKYKIIIILLISSLITEKNQNICNNPAAIAYSFVKSVTLGDTLLFYKKKKKRELAKNINKNYRLDRKIQEDELHTLYFFKFAPWKIKYDELINKENVFESKCNFLLIITEVNVNNLLLHVKWNRKNKLLLNLRCIKSEWKVVNVQ